MIRITRKVFTDLTIWMVGLGLVIGFLFPFFIFSMGVPSHYVLTHWFFAACMASGFIVSAANIILAKVVVGTRLRNMADSMRRVEDYLKEISQKGDIKRKLPEFCTLEVDSEDEIGTSAQAFNSLVQSQLYALRTDAAVREFIEMITSQTGLNNLATKALQRLMQDSTASAGAMLVVMKGKLKVASSHGIRSPENVTESDYVRLAQQTKEIQTVELPKDTLVENILSDIIPREIIVAPILYEAELLGMIVLASATGFSDKDKERMILFLKGLALAMRNSIDHENLQQLAVLDPLSGIYNRRFGLSRLHEEFSRAVRASTPLSVLMCDIDHFKKINDTYGHLIGDRVINHFVGIARGAVREGDIVVRYGGDEFLLILPGASKEDVKKAGERIRSLMRESVVREMDQEIRVTISMGIAEYLGDEINNANELVNKADSRLYEAKGVGRDRVVAE